MKRWLVAAVLVLVTVTYIAVDQSYAPSPADLARYAARAEELCKARGHTIPPHPFTTDGCSLWPDGNDVEACIRHDMAYWCGGTAQERQSADDALAEDVGGIRGTLMKAVVRISGSPLLPFPWRWGYGRPYGIGK